MVQPQQLYYIPKTVYNYKMNDFKWFRPSAYYEPKICRIYNLRNYT